MDNLNWFKITKCSITSAGGGIIASILIGNRLYVDAFGKDMTPSLLSVIDK